MPKRAPAILPANPGECAINREQWERVAPFPELPADIQALLDGVFGNSPYLSRQIIKHPDILQRLVDLGPQKAVQRLEDRISLELATCDDTAAIMRLLRHSKAEVSVVTALADIADVWPLEQVTRCLSDFAACALQACTEFLLRRARARGEIQPADSATLSAGCGLIVLGMGKLGAYELNYSSDIDLILLFEPGCIGYKGRQNEQYFFNRFAHDLVQLMSERTADGYVFRTDLRLRPDPASTPPVVSTEAAVYYYESVGQNWERAAMIKARAVAGDMAAGEAFLRRISPFMWRRHLDFAAINDIHSIKRQMDTRAGRDIRLAGHNIKLGIGGIREIEFFVQVNQLIWGGRNPRLRLRGTLESLERLVEDGIVPDASAASLKQAYLFLRMLEHRLQMIADQQTHSLPESTDGLRHVAFFCGFSGTEELENTLLHHLHVVHEIFAGSFKSAEQLGDVGNLVFTGTVHDPDTLATLSHLGFKQPEKVSEIVMSWHHGARRCTRTKRARELLTELMPALLKALAETADADNAFMHFDRFLNDLPAGVQLFSLFTANPELLKLIADIMGSAPLLAEQLGRHPELLEAVLYASFYQPLPGKEELAAQLAETLKIARHPEERLHWIQRFKHEKEFQAGVQLLKSMQKPQQTGIFLAELAEVVLDECLRMITQEFTTVYGRIPGARFCVIGLGRLGSREMTPTSDIDLVFVYDVPDLEAVSDGEKGFSASVYYNRLCQRYLSALTMMSAEGRLYDVDTRLRPSGKQGLLAVSVPAMRHYFAHLAWTFEFMALTRARAVAGDASLMREMDAFIAQALASPRDASKLKGDVGDMRKRVARELPATSAWDVKYARGGLMDLDFLAQYLLLRHAEAYPLLTLAKSTPAIFSALTESGLLDAEVEKKLNAAYVFETDLLHFLRLSSRHANFSPPAGAQLRGFLAHIMGMENFSALEARLNEVESEAFATYLTFIIS